MPLRTLPNIPNELLGFGQRAVGFFQRILNYEHRLIQTGMRVKWVSTATPYGNYLKCDGATITNSDYPELVAYAANDVNFTVGATTTVLPTDAGFWVKT